jgi:hypothetical protein
VLQIGFFCCTEVWLGPYPATLGPPPMLPWTCSMWACWSAVMMFDDQAVPVMQEDRAGRGDADGRGEEAAQRRRRVKEHGVKAHRAMEKGGSSYESLAQLIESFKQRDASADKVTP